MKRLLVSVVLVALMSLPAYAQSKRMSLDEATKQAQQISDRYVTAVNTQNAQGIADLFAPDGVLILPTGAVFKSPEEIKRFYIGFFPTMNQDLTFRSFVDQVHLLGNGAWAIGRTEFVSKGEGKVASKAHWASVYQIKNGHLIGQMLSVGADVPLPAKAKSAEK